MAEPTQVTQPTTRHWVCAVGATLTMIAASVVLSGLSLVTAPIVADLYTAADGVTPTNGGSAAFLVYFTVMTFAIVVALMFFSGRLLAALGAKTMVIFGGIIMAAGLALFAISTHSWMFYAAGLIIGAGYGLSLALVPPALITAWFIEKKGLVLGVVLSGTGVGGFIWSFILPPLMKTSPTAWRGAVWIMAAALLALTVIPGLLLITNQPADKNLKPYGAETPRAAAAMGKRVSVDRPGLSYHRALRSSAFWISGVGFFLFGIAVAVTQVLSIVFNTAAYPNPTDRTTWTADQVSFYSLLYMVWTLALVFWKPVLGLLNDKIGLVKMMVVTLALMALAYVYVPSMVYGSSTWLMLLAMIGISCGISNATVSPPLVMAEVAGPREFGKIFSLSLAFYFAGNALGAPLWGLLGNAGKYSLGMYLAPLLLAGFVIASVMAIRIGKASWEPPSHSTEAEDATAETARATER